MTLCTTFFRIYLNKVTGFQKFPVFCYILPMILHSLFLFLHSYIKA